MNKIANILTAGAPEVDSVTVRKLYVSPKFVTLGPIQNMIRSTHDGSGDDSGFDFTATS